jgi:hypothetical protein
VRTPHQSPPPCDPMDGRRACLLRWVSAARGPCWQWPSSTSRRKKQLRVGTARGLCPRPCPEVSVCLGSYDRVLLRPSRCADLPTPTRAAGQHWPRRASGDGQHAPLAGSDDAEARWAASGRCGGFAQSCGRRWSSDRGRSDLCWRHQQGSCGPVSRVSVRASQDFDRTFVAASPAVHFRRIEVESWK